MVQNELTPDQLDQFNEWVADGNATKIDDNIWLEQTTQWTKQFSTDELQKFFKKEYLSDSENSDKNIKFIEYKNFEIMFEPVYNEYFVNDKQFDSLEEAKEYIDAGSPMSEKMINAYRHGAFKSGGITPKRYRITNKITGAIHFESANTPNEAILLVIKKVQMLYPNITPNDFVASITEQFKDGVSVDNSFDYKMLDRLRQDNDYFLGNGNRSEKHLWAGNVKEQIAEMKLIWNRLQVKPEWLSMEDILDYERKMAHSPKNKFADGGSIEQQNYEMTQSNNKAIMHHSKELDNILKTTKTIPAWALALVNQSSENLSSVTHYLDGAKKFADGGITPKVYGENVVFLDINGNEQIGMVQDMDDQGAELFYEERFIKIPIHRIVKFN